MTIYSSEPEFQPTGEVPVYDDRHVDGCPSRYCKVENADEHDDCRWCRRIEVSKSESLARAHRIKAEQEQHIAATTADVLIDECLERLIPILTHKRDVSYMSIPVDYERDDDVFIIERLREVKRRLRMEPPE